MNLTITTASVGYPKQLDVWGIALFFFILLTLAVLCWKSHTIYLYKMLKLLRKKYEDEHKMCAE